MTIIAVTQGLVLADGRRADAKGDYVDSNAGKIHLYTQPVRLRSVVQGFTDTFYGWAGSGEDETIHAAGLAALGNDGQLDLWLEQYLNADKLRLLNDSTAFSVMFFGLDGVALAECVTGRVEMQYFEYGEYSRVATGSGARPWNHVMKSYKDEICPVRAMFTTFVMEPSCGGEVEVWALPTQRRGTQGKLRLLDTFAARDLQQCCRMGAHLKKFYYQEESNTWLKSLIPRLERNSKRRSKTATSTPLPRLLELLYSSSSAPAQVKAPPA